MFEYIDAWLRVLGKLRVFAIVLNIIVLIAAIWLLYNSGFFTRQWYNEEKAAVSGYLSLISFLNIFCICRPRQHYDGANNSSLVALWWKRKKLEHLAKIKELEK